MCAAFSPDRLLNVGSHHHFRFMTILRVLAILAAICLIIFPVFDRRVRLRWSFYAFVGAALLVFVSSGFRLLEDFHLINVSKSTDWKITLWLMFGRGVALGLILALIISGQLLGKKVLNKT